MWYVVKWDSERRGAWRASGWCFWASAGVGADQGGGGGVGSIQDL